MSRVPLFAICVSALVAVVAPSAAHATNDAAVTGIVEDALLHPLAGATVLLHDSAGATVANAVTSADGKFTFAGIPFGDYTVEATLTGLVGDHQHLQLGTAEIAPVELVLVNSEEVVQIHEDWSVPGPSKATGSVTTLSRQKLAELPGAEDRPVTDVIATQAGFVGDGLGNVYARGNHANIQYQIDGIPIPDSVGSLFAASIPVRLIQNLEIYTGGIPAEFGDRLGAVVNLSTRQGTQTPDGTAQVRYGSYQTVEPGAAYSTTVGKTGVFIGGSFMYSQRALDPPSIDPILHDTGETGRVFLRLDRDLTKTDRVELIATYAHNEFQIPLDPSVGPLLPGETMRPADQFGNAAPPFVPTNTNATETENELFTAVSWVHTCTCNGDRTQVAPYYKLSTGYLRSDPTHALGPTADPGSTASDVDRQQQHVGAVANESIVRGGHHLKAGVQTDYQLGTTDFASYQRNEVTPGGGIDSALTVRGSDETDALLSGAYLQDAWTHGDLVVNGGLRVDELHVILGDGTTRDDVGVSPRLGSSLQLDKDLAVHAFGGVNWQPPAVADASAAARALGVVAPGQPIVYDLKPETDLYGEAGASWRVWKALRAGLTGWGRYAWNQLDDTAVGSTSLLSNYNFSRGRAVGVETNLDFRVGSWLTAFGNGSFEIAQGQGISSAKYLFTADQIANTSWQTLDHAQTWTANVGASIHDKRFTLTGLTAYGSGLRTGDDNTSHVPGHIRSDLTMQYTFTPSGYPVRVGVDVINVFDAHYAYRIANGFVGSSFAPPRTVYVSLSIPLSREAHTEASAAMPTPD